MFFFFFYRDPNNTGYQGPLMLHLFFFMQRGVEVLFWDDSTKPPRYAT